MRQLDVEQLELAIDAGNFTVAVDEHGGVIDAIGFGLRTFVNAAQQNHHPVASRRFAKSTHRRALEGFGNGELARPRAQVKKHLGKSQQVGAALDRPGHQIFGDGQVLADLLARGHLRERESYHGI